MHYVVFAIDNLDIRSTARFMRYIDERIAMSKTKGNVMLGIGCYLDQLEQCYIMRQDDFDTFVRNSGYVDGQESFMVTDQKRMWLEYPAENELVYCGFLRTTSEMPKDASGWTYRPDLCVYWSLEPVAV